jgi:hypothetical protein
MQYLWGTVGVRRAFVNQKERRVAPEAGKKPQGRQGRQPKAIWFSQKTKRRPSISE